jgi:hypothetical protein
VFVDRVLSEHQGPHGNDRREASLEGNVVAHIPRARASQSPCEMLLAGAVVLVKCCAAYCLHQRRWCRQASGPTSAATSLLLLQGVVVQRQDARNLQARVSSLWGGGAGEMSAGRRHNSGAKSG